MGDLVATDEVAAVKDMFESRPVTVPKETFLVGVAKTLLAAAAVFGKGRLDDQVKKSATLKRARECLQPALDGSDTALQSEAKALARKISGELRPLVEPRLFPISCNSSMEEMVNLVCCATIPAKCNWSASC